MTHVFWLDPLKPPGASAPRGLPAKAVAKIRGANGKYSGATASDFDGLPFVCRSPPPRLAPKRGSLSFGPFERPS